ncbi:MULTISPECIES: GNAT family N-acetyltransferase [Idiomarinaceae]|uniref:GNAT family N-acetyltransferase n=1 Tax=Pseudidiomarina fusca TaxID=2965078 RepID=A0ABU3KXU0_9GAMM|nr:MULTISPECIES: N-acetyltransferase [Idiomarinaceae]MDT7525822.1 GNAT family N-acetyltransferase [Pseudidiomarina sp. GXY010]MRJ41606.1 GNAT family N-acetyltransferase [Idiomarina sp. FeN1]NCU57596.1 GNAT family N-acetyltransferase [Idiomarina sp. FenA--70]NCU60148.1 GNAT family N-acetyltransferase [Idiomarina sp. FenBw--71]UUN13761.1 GNAT family N-acetyltransferase [Idiomarina loihiensis]
MKNKSTATAATTRNSSAWHIRQALLADVPALVALEHQVFDYSRIGRASFRRLVQRPSARVYVAYNDGQQLLGYYLLLTRKNSRKWRIYSIATAAAARGTGLGKALLRHAMHLAQQAGASALSLEVRTDNHAAIGLYQAHHFAVVDVLPGYYDDGDSTEASNDGYRMQVTFAELAD